MFYTQLLVDNGTKTQCGIAFTKEPDHGIRLNATNDMRIVANGTDVYALGSSQSVPLVPIRSWVGESSQSGTAGSPDYSFLGDTDTGMYQATDGLLEFSTAGARAGYFDSTQNLHVTGSIIGEPDAITATSTGVAASVVTLNTEVTTNDDNDLDNVTLANGVSGQVKHIYCVVSFAGDTWKITPATMLGGSTITFGDNSVGTGCTLVYAATEGWTVVGNNGGTIA